MKTLVINTQYRENYAAHNEDFVEGVSLDYWKFKGGSTYFVTDLTESQVARIEAKGIPNLSNLIEYSNAGSQEYILDYEVRELGKNGDGKGPICEPWETPIQFYYSDSEWKCRTHHTYGEDEYIAKPIIGKAEQWTPREGGDRKTGSYTCQYKTPNGWFDQAHPQLKEEVENAKMEAV